jgi:hypothetical protein
MPLPEREKGQPKSEFIVDCMDNEKMKIEYSDPAQRYAVCRAQADK